MQTPECALFHKKEIRMMVELMVLALIASISYSKVSIRLFIVLRIELEAKEDNLTFVFSILFQKEIVESFHLKKLETRYTSIIYVKKNQAFSM